MTLYHPKNQSYYLKPFLSHSGLEMNERISWKTKQKSDSANDRAQFLPCSCLAGIKKTNFNPVVLFDFVEERKERERDEEWLWNKRASARDFFRISGKPVAIKVSKTCVPLLYGHIIITCYVLLAFLFIYSRNAAGGGSPCSYLFYSFSVKNWWLYTYHHHHLRGTRIMKNDGLTSFVSV